jgi:O-antigen/teichoic acid export membrane protein
VPWTDRPPPKGDGAAGHVEAPRTASGRRRPLLNTLMLVGGTGIGQTLMLLSLPLLTRLFTPAEFGAMAVFLAIVVPLATVSGLRYDMAIPVADDDGEARSLLWAALAFTALLAALLVAVLLLIGPRLGHLLNVSDVISWWWLLPLSVGLSGAYNALSFAAIRNKTYGALSASRAMQGIGQVGTQVTLGFLGAGVEGLLLGIVARFGASALTLVRRPRARRDSVPVDRRDVRRAVRKYRRFPIFMGNASLLTALSQHLPSLALAVLYGPAIAGLFSLSIRALEAPVTLVAQMSAQVYYGNLSEAARSEPARMRAIFRTTVTGLAAVGVVPFLLFLFGPQLFPLLFGSAWSEAGAFARILAFTFLVRFLARGVGSETLAVTGRYGTQLWLEGARVAGIGLAFGLAAVADLTSTTTVILYAAVMAVAHLLTLAASSRALREVPEPT